jgi:eukaryotic-like serine/threonine-protein kinase
VDLKFGSVTGRFSPDGHWIAYSSNESGKNEVSVRPFNSATGAVGDPIVVTSGGGRTPLWRGDGKELFYIGADGIATAVSVETGATFHAGAPMALFPVTNGILFWDVAPDGQRFLLPAPGN